jgi:glycosyltransferase involved in cell wall biosynthesis
VDITYRLLLGVTMRIAMIGTRGVPARYGGFETAVEEVGRRLTRRGHDVTVYCRNPHQTLTSYQGMRLVNLPALRRRHLETLSHTFLSVVHATMKRRPDVAVVFNAANAPLLPMLRAAGIPLAVHVDGLEWKRGKWAGAGARYYRWAEKKSVEIADALIADARGIADHIAESYGRDSIYIPYGAPLVRPGHERLGQLGLASRSFHLVVARFAPENHVTEIVAGYVASAARNPLVVVGSAPYDNEYTQQVHAAADRDPRVMFLGSVWDQGLLDQLYANALSYIHGHSVGGTNPSLLRAMGAGAPVTAYDAVFNREVVNGHARYWMAPSEVALAVIGDEQDAVSAIERGEKGRDHAELTYRWDEVADEYEQLCLNLTRGV